MVPRPQRQPTGGKGVPGAGGSYILSSVTRRAGSSRSVEAAIPVRRRRSLQVSAPERRGRGSGGGPGGPRGGGRLRARFWGSGLRGALGLGRRAGSASAAGGGIAEPVTCGQGREAGGREAADVVPSPSRAGGACPAAPRSRPAGPEPPEVSAPWLRASRAPPGYGKEAFGRRRGAWAPGAVGLRSRGLPGGCTLDTTNGSVNCGFCYGAGRRWGPPGQLLGPVANLFISPLPQPSPFFYLQPLSE